jgi:NADH:ubiquinone oxidoreductase subunit E
MVQNIATVEREDIRAEEEVDPRVIASILEKHADAWGELIAVLEEIQLAYGYLPEKALRTVAERTGRSLVEVYGVATFYRSFSLQPRGKHLISVCLGTACHVRGAPTIAEELKRQLGIEAGETTLDKEFTLETVNCLGACALGPVVVIDGHYFSKVRKSKVRQLLDGALQGFDEIGGGQGERLFPLDVNCPRCNHSLMDASITIDGRSSIRLTVSFDHKNGWLRLSCLYGSYNISAEHPIPLGTVVSFFCPHCHAKLIGSWECPICGAPMVPMIVREGGIVQICSRRGCRSHMLDLGGANI